MATIKSGDSFSHLSVDSTSSAIRASLYDLEKSEVATNTFVAAMSVPSAGHTTATTPKIMFTGNSNILIKVLSVEVNGPTVATLGANLMTIHKGFVSFPTTAPGLTPYNYLTSPTNKNIMAQAPYPRFYGTNPTTPTDTNTLGRLCARRFLGKSTTVVDGSEMGSADCTFFKSPVILRGENEALIVFLPVAVATTTQINIMWSETDL